MISSDLKLTKKFRTRSQVEFKNEEQSQMELNNKSCINTDKDKTVGSFLTAFTHSASAGL